MKIVGGIWIKLGGFFNLSFYVFDTFTVWRSITYHCIEAKVTTAMLSISIRYLCRNIKRRVDFSRYLKRFMIWGLFLPSSQTSGRMYNTVVSIKFMIWKMCRSPTLCRYLQTIIACKWQKQGSLSNFRFPTGWGLRQFIWESQRE
jgi:hypothetical protein